MENKLNFKNLSLYILERVLAIIITCILFVGVAIAVSPTDTYVYGYQVKYISEDNLLGDSYLDGYTGRVCFVSSASSDMLQPGDIAVFAKDGRSVFGEVIKVNENYSVVISDDDNGEMIMPADTLRGVVVHLF